MTMKIEVTIPEDEVRSGAAAQYLRRAMSAIGFEKASPTMREVAEAAYDAGLNVRVELAKGAEDPIGDDSPLRRHAVAEEPEQAEAPKRERGKPAPGKARRTKEEIAEDEAADRADAAAASAEEPKAAISTDEERIDPTTAEDAAQDAADEAAEAEATKPAELTHDSVRAALQKYLNLYGAPATMEDGPKVFKMLFGETAAKVSDIPTDQASLAKAVAGVEEMCLKNPFSRSVNL